MANGKWRSSPVIHAEGLTKVFRGGRTGDVVAVKELDLRVQAGLTFGMIGPDGAGKSTTVRLLAGLLKPSAGRATVLGFPSDARRRSTALKERIGYMAQQANLYGDLTVMENLRFFANLQGVDRREQSRRIPELLRFAGLNGVEERFGSQLSGGMRKKLALATVLVHNPTVVFLDEPTLGVDPSSRREFWDLLAALRAQMGLTIFVCTPYMDEAERCHEVALIYEGQIVATGAPKRITAQVPGQLLDCRPSHLHRARPVVKNLPGVLEVQTLGDRLRVFVDDSGLRAPQIEAALLAQGMTTGPVRQVQPRLEEAFISLVRRQRGERDDGVELQALLAAEGEG